MGKKQKEYLKRFRAIDLYNQGLKPTQIYEKLKRSKRWFFKHLKNYRLYGTAGLKEKSRRPKKLNRKYPSKIISDVIKVRKDLSTAETEETRYKFFGAKAVCQELINRGYSDKQIPKERWINHIIKREGLIIKPDKRRRRKSNKFYPLLKPTKVNEVHQMDNHCCFSGSLTHKRSISKVVRLCLFLRV
jgi:transposase